MNYQLNIIKFDIKHKQFFKHKELYLECNQIIQI